MKERLVWLDALKGIGILSIMRVHMVQPMELFQSWVYVGAVAMFFVLAGFNLRYPTNTKDAIIGKAKRLLIPYFAYSLLLLIIEHHFNANTLVQIEGIFYGRSTIGKDVGAQGLMLLGNAPMWFLLCMFLSYVWVYMIYCRCKTNNQKTTCLVCFVAISVGLYFVPIRLPWSLDTSFMLAALLCIGYELREYFMHANKYIILLCLVFWMALYYTAGGYNISLGDYGKFSAIGIIPIMGIVLAETYSLSGLLQMIERTWFSKALAYLGRQSLRLMCIHLVIYIRLENIFASHVPTIHDNKWMLLCISFCAILIVNACIDFTVKKLQKKYIVFKYL